jgi:hypothetical protein
MNHDSKRFSYERLRQHQYRVTEGEIDRLQQAIDKLREQPNISTSQLVRIQNSFQTQIDRMQMEIQEYDDRQVIT